MANCFLFCFFQGTWKKQIYELFGILKEKIQQAKLLKEFYALSTKEDGKYSFRVFPNGDSSKIISKEGKKKFLFALDSKVEPADFLSMKEVEFNQQ